MHSERRKRMERESVEGPIFCIPRSGEEPSVAIDNDL